MSFSIKKGDFLIEIEKTKGNVVVRLSRKEKETKETKETKEKETKSSQVFGIPHRKNELLFLQNNKWIPYPLKEKKSIITSVIDVIQKEEKLEFDEAAFVEAIIYDLINDRSLFWVPDEGKYEFYGDKLYSTVKGWQYEYEMPRAKGISRKELKLVQQTLPDTSPKSSTIVKGLPSFPTIPPLSSVTVSSIPSSVPSSVPKQKQKQKQQQKQKEALTKDEEEVMKSLSKIKL